MSFIEVREIQPLTEQQSLELFARLLGMCT